MKRLFNTFCLLPRGGFRTTGEQIDGSFVLAGETYLLEAKWQNTMTSAADLREFQGKIDARMTWARGLFVSYGGFSSDGLIAYGRGGSVICVDGLDLHDALKAEIPLNHVLEQKVRCSVETGEVLVGAVHCLHGLADSSKGCLALAAASTFPVIMSVL